MSRIACPMFMKQHDLFFEDLFQVPQFEKSTRPYPLRLRYLLQLKPKISRQFSNHWQKRCCRRLQVSYRLQTSSNRALRIEESLPDFPVTALRTVSFAIAIVISSPPATRPINISSFFETSITSSFFPTA